MDTCGPLAEGTLRGVPSPCARDRETVGRAAARYCDLINWPRSRSREAASFRQPSRIKGAAAGGGARGSRAPRSKRQEGGGGGGGEGGGGLRVIAVWSKGGPREHKADSAE